MEKLHRALHRRPVVVALALGAITVAVGWSGALALGAGQAPAVAHAAVASTLSDDLAVAQQQLRNCELQKKYATTASEHAYADTCIAIQTKVITALKASSSPSPSQSSASAPAPAHVEAIATCKRSSTSSASSSRSPTPLPS